MRKIVAILLLASVCFKCEYQPAVLTDAELREKLKKTMTGFLYQGVKNDSSVVKYHVMQVIYYNAPAVYDCEFKVEMKDRRTDTIGTMKARIYKDFVKVERVY